MRHKNETTTLLQQYIKNEMEKLLSDFKIVKSIFACSNEKNTNGK